MHLAEIRSFQEFFGVVYYPTLRLRDTVAQAAQVLRQKWELKAKKSKLVVPPGEEGLSFVIRKTGFRFPSLPTSKFALAFPPVLPKWVDHININVLANQALPPRKRVTWTKYHLWNFPYHVPVEIFNHISLNMRIGQALQVISPVAHSSKDQPVVIEDDDDDDDEDDDVSLADKLKSRKRGLVFPPLVGLLSWHLMLKQKSLTKRVVAAPPFRLMFMSTLPPILHPVRILQFPFLQNPKLKVSRNLPRPHPQLRRPPHLREGGRSGANLVISLLAVPEAPPTRALPKTLLARRLRVQLLPSAKQSPFQARMTALCLLQNRLPLCNIRLLTRVALHLMCLVKSSTLYLRRTRWQL
ncbi:uncharacterized protein LOC130738462 [Lotus japonicus]|uniref:uncharacterized protein LOC130738462 n=1 Tax=Lotus japonicus TaxID=34305 RepID=UPI0025860B12|nr:uncharacterized protein LOC130738462 [Lotus japonicus]